MNTRNSPSTKSFKPFFELKAHNYQKRLHGRLFEFEYPLFSTDLLGPGKTGLFVSIKDDLQLDAFLFIDPQTLRVMMNHDTDETTDLVEDQVMDFANRNKSMMSKLVLDLNTAGRDQAQDFVLVLETAEVTLAKGRTVRVYRFPTVEPDNSLRLTR